MPGSILASPGLRNFLKGFEILLFILVCFSLGEICAILLTSLIYSLDPLDLFDRLAHPAGSDRSVLLLLLSLSAVFRFLIIPTLYYSVQRKNPVTFSLSGKVNTVPMLLIGLLMIGLAPMISALIDVNHRIAFPEWLSDAETYFQESEARAVSLTSIALSFSKSGHLILAILTMAVIPGILEEFFFRGLVQGQFQKIMKNPHYAIFLTASLFSLMHLQFYGFIPRLLLGLLFGYLFFWSKNIWYPVTAHALSNLIAIVGVHFFDWRIGDSDGESSVSTILILLSFLLSSVCIFYIRKHFTIDRHHAV